MFAAKGVRSDSATCPDWYVLLQAAKYIGVAPWDLLERSIWWREIALKAMSAEAEAREILKSQPT